MTISTTPDPENEVGKAISKKATEVFAKYLEAFIGKADNYIDLTLRKKSFSFSGYITKTANRCAFVKVMIDKERLYEIDEIYVPTNFTCSNRTYSDTVLFNNIVANKRVVVQGFGGIGKTIFLKKLWKYIFETSSSKIPIFIELRRLNSITKIDILSYIRIDIYPDSSKFSEAVFTSFLQDGKFVFLFDGFDEVSEELRLEVQSQILSLSYTYPNCGCVVSSRKDDRFNSWEIFESYSAMHFDKNQITKVIQNVTFNKEVKLKFINNIIKKKNAQYDSFLNTPLMSLMMLLTYDQFGEVPEKVHIFYRYAFQTLYSLHDGSKEAFSRKRKTGLDEEEFVKVFSIFSMITYFKYLYAFSYDQLREYVVNAIKTAKLSKSVSPEDFIEESIQSVNLLFLEGDQYIFTHRSMQEYFCAYSMVNFFQKNITKLVYEIYNRNTDSVLAMCYDMGRSIIDQNFVIPEFQKYRSELEKFVKIPVSDANKSDVDLYSIYFHGSLNKANKRNMYLYIMSCVCDFAAFLNTMVRLLPVEFEKRTNLSTEEPFLFTPNRSQEKWYDDLESAIVFKEGDSQDQTIAFVFYYPSLKFDLAQVINDAGVVKKNYSSCNAKSVSKVFDSQEMKQLIARKHNNTLKRSKYIIRKVNSIIIDSISKDDFIESILSDEPD